MSRNCPGASTASTARRTWFQSAGATCHSSSSRGRGPASTRAGSTASAWRAAVSTSSSTVEAASCWARRVLPQALGPSITTAPAAARQARSSASASGGGSRRPCRSKQCSKNRAFDAGKTGLLMQGKLAGRCRKQRAAGPGSATSPTPWSGTVKSLSTISWDGPEASDPRQRTAGVMRSSRAAAHPSGASTSRSRLACAIPSLASANPSPCGKTWRAAGHAASMRNIAWFIGSMAICW